LTTLSLPDTRRTVARSVLDLRDAVAYALPLLAALARVSRLRLAA
jgi:hypothetical protein